MTFSRILATGSYLPEKILTNDDLSKMVETSDEWIVTRTGIKERRIAGPKDTAFTMGAEAAARALEQADVDPKSIDLIIVATSTPDQVFPSTASLIQEKLGINVCPAFDISVACAGFNYALSIADKFIRTGAAKRALVIGSELMSKIIDWNDRSVCIIFGDGAGAVILENSEQPGIESTHLYAEGKYKDLLYCPNILPQTAASSEGVFARMQGSEVFKLAVEKLGQTVIQTLQDNNLTKDSIDWLIPHQANYRIIKAVAKRLDLPMSKVVLTVDKHGNTSAASVPLALDVAVRDGRIKRGDRLLLESFGGGLAWGSALIVF